MTDARRPRLLVTGFGPFPGAPENPTDRLIRALADERPAAFGAGALKAVVLPTDYRKSWDMLRRLYAGFAPDVVVHFGLSLRAGGIRVERLARNAVDPAKPDAAGFAPRLGLARRFGPDILAATLPVEAIVDRLSVAGHPATPSDDAGGYVCNATLYRSLYADAAPHVGFIHVPRLTGGTMDPTKLAEAACLALRVAVNEKSSPSATQRLAHASYLTGQIEDERGKRPRADGAFVTE